MFIIVYLGSLMMAASLLVLTVFAGYQYSLLGYHRRETCSYNAPDNNTTTDHLHKNAFAHADFIPPNSTDFQSSVCDSESLPASLRYVSFVALVVYVAAYSLSFGPITWILLSELFPDAAAHIGSKREETRLALSNLLAMSAERDERLRQNQLIQRYFDDYRELMAWSSEVLAKMTSPDLATDLTGEW